MKKSVTELSEVIKMVLAKNRSMSARFVILKNKQIELNRQILAVMRKIEVLRCHGTPLKRTEQVYVNIFYTLLHNIYRDSKISRDIWLS